MEQAYLTTSNLAVGYRKTALFHSLHLNIREGEVIALIGPNGSGKSTLLKSLARQIPLVDGSVYLDGKDLSAMTAGDLAKQMAVVLTGPLRAEQMRCIDVVAMGRYPYTGRLGILSKTDRQKVWKALEQVDAASLADRDYREISDGQRQRILLARAICQEPKVILLDEPTTFLDIHHKIKLLTILRKMAKENQITVILSLHEIDLAQKAADRVLCVKGDVLEPLGTPEEIFREDRIRALYEMESGTYEPFSGSLEMPAPAGEPKIFVIGGGGAGIGLYRRLQRENIPFAAGILYPTDLDYPVAKALAAEVVEELPYQEIREETLQKALAQMSSCEKVLAAPFIIGPMNRRLLELVETAKSMGKLA